MLGSLKEEFMRPKVVRDYKLIRSSANQRVAQNGISSQELRSHSFQGTLGGIFQWEFYSLGGWDLGKVRRGQILVLAKGLWSMQKESQLRNNL